MNACGSCVNLPLTIALNSSITVAQYIIKAVAISSQSCLSVKANDGRNMCIANCCILLFSVHSSVNCGGLYESS